MIPVLLPCGKSPPVPEDNKKEGGAKSWRDTDSSQLCIAVVFSCSVVSDSLAQSDIGMIFPILGGYWKYPMVFPNIGSDISTLLNSLV